MSNQILGLATLLGVLLIMSLVFLSRKGLNRRKLTAIVAIFAFVGAEVTFIALSIADIRANVIPEADIAPSSESVKAGISSAKGKAAASSNELTSAVPTEAPKVSLYLPQATKVNNAVTEGQPTAKPATVEPVPLAAEEVIPPKTVELPKDQTENPLSPAAAPEVAKTTTEPETPAATEEKSPPTALPVPPVERNPLDVERSKKLLSKGGDAFKRSDYTAAVAAYSELIGIEPRSLKAFHNRGLAYHMAGNFAAAIEDFGTALEIEPRSADTLYGRGLAHLKLNQQDAAITDFDQVIALKPDYAAAYYNRGLAYRSSNRPQQSATDFEKAAELDPKFRRQ